jgi:diacylglycerol kinase
VTLPGEDLKQAAARPGSVLRTFKAVAWSFFGVRQASQYEKDLAQLNPVHVVVAGVVAAAAFVLALVLLVKWVVGSGVAG